MMMTTASAAATPHTATNLNRGHPQPAPRTQKGREVARSNLEAASVAENKHDLSRLERILMASRNEDLNLAALISAVEKDIWYMEQLESNPSIARRKNSPDELPFPITDELIKLPGYKPKMPPLVSSFVDTNSPQTPPVLPPKINNIQRLPSP